MRMKLKKSSQRNSLENFLLSNVELACSEESFNAVTLAKQIGTTIEKIREWARVSPYTSYCRGSVHFPPVILVNVQTLRSTAEQIAIEEAEEAKKKVSEASAASYVKQVVIGDIGAAIMLLQSALGLQGLSDALRAALDKACIAAEVARAEAQKEL